MSELITDAIVRGRYCDGVYAQTGHATEGEDFDRWLARRDARPITNAAVEDAARIYWDAVTHPGNWAELDETTRVAERAGMREALEAVAGALRGES